MNKQFLFVLLLKLLELNAKKASTKVSNLLSTGTMSALDLKIDI